MDCNDMSVSGVAMISQWGEGGWRSLSTQRWAIFAIFEYK